jgi:hypothetical protein
MRVKRCFSLLSAVLLLAILMLMLTSCGILDMQSGLYFRATLDNQGCYVTDYSVWLVDDTLMIPPSYRDRPVVGIDELALIYATCSSITVPASVTYIGAEAFLGGELTELRFAEPKGWYVYETGEAISAALLKDPEAAARLFTTGALADYTVVRVAQ